VTHLLALDFDGVISDSAAEAYVVALRTYAALQPDTKLREELARLGAGEGAAPARDVVTAAPLYAPFLELMPLGNRAEDYGVMLAAIEAKADVPDQSAYDAFRDALGREWPRSFHKRFYVERKALSDADPEAWRGLMGPYERFCVILRRNASRAELAIATAKDRRSVKALLESYGLADLFRPERVLDKETGVSKRSHVEHLHRTTGIPLPDITFVDDKVNHLESVAPLGARCGLAAWGYNGPREEALARERGFRVVTLDDAEAQLFGNG